MVDVFNAVDEKIVDVDQFVILVGKITISKKFWIPPNDQKK